MFEVKIYFICFYEYYLVFVLNTLCLLLFCIEVLKHGKFEGFF